MDEMLQKRLEPVLRRIRIRRVATALGLIWIIAAIAGAWFFFLNQSRGFDTSQVIWLILGLTLVASLVAVFHALSNAKRIHQVVEDLEREFPDLDSSLMTAMELQPEPGKRLGFLQQDVMRKAVTHSYENRWPSIIPGWHLVAAPMAGFFGLIAFAATMICLVFFVKPSPVDETIRFADAAVISSDFEISVEPGNTEIERGTSLLVLARFTKSFPPDATLVFADEQGVESRLPMSKSLDDPVFGARISSVNQPITYRVEFAERESDPFDVNVFDFPRLVRADAKLKYPAYTELEDKIVQDIRRVNAVEGTTAELSFFVNKPLVGAVLAPRGDDDDLKPIPLVVDPNDPKKITAIVPMQRSRKLELILLDGDNRENRSPPKFVLNVLQNRPPELKLLAPGRDVEASPIEEVQLSASAWDDFGLKKFGVHFGIIGQDTQEIVLEQKSLGKKRKQVDHLLELEKMKAEPDNLVSYYFFAEDIGPDGQERMVASDMYFAEVRHFDEIFRQGQAPPQGQQQQQQQQQSGQNAQQAQELGELQKDIINGTWKVIRREKKKSLSATFGEDLDLLIQSQNEAIEKLAELAENVEDEKSLAHVEAVRTFMNESVLHLTEANNNADVEKLKPALSTEQAAYQGLLKLRAREHEVVRQQQQQQQQAGQQQQNNRAQQQLNDLQLKKDDNRYENEKTAQEQTQQDEEASEDRQVLNRLRELARRQGDLNERVKELQSALEEAETAEEREEIERRLKSLREQQEQMLRDAEELAERMQNEENQQRMSEESEQLDKTRESLQRANEALEKNEVSRAAAEGTRAQRELEELRDEFQNRTAGQFTEQMRQMRNEAQELEQKEQEIADALAGEEIPVENEKNKTPTLRESEDEKPDLQKQLTDQKEAVEKLRDRMKETIEEAETFEPLLAEDLYDTYRDSEETRPDQALDSARQSLNRGWIDDARKEEQRARAGITQIREGIEKAAESVLGDETEALKAAQDTLRELNRDLNQELQDKARDQQRDVESAQGQQDREGQSGESERQSDQEPKQGKGREEGQRESSQGRENEEPQEGQRGQGEPGEGEPNDQPQEGQRGQGEPQEGQQPQEGQRGQGEPQEGQQPGQREGQRGQGEPQEGQQTQEGQSGGGEGGNDQPNDAERLRQQMRDLNNNQRRSNDGQIGGAPNQQWNGGDQRMRPISGDDFRDWSDRLRDVEEMIADPELRAEASRIREQAREIRKDMKRHSEEPNWDLVKMKVAKPLAELQDRVAEELMRRSASDVLIPLDRDPVPAEYQDAVRRYYERLGSGQ